MSELLAQPSGDSYVSGSAPDGGGLASLFAPRGVVVVGASNDSTKLGGVMAASLAGYSGGAARVNARGGPGVHTTVAQAAAVHPSPLDLAVLCVPAAACAHVVEECAEVGIGSVLICAGGFAEASDEGAAHQQRLVEVATRTGVRVVGPNTSGFFVPRRGLRASFVPGVAELTPGHVAVVAASGGLNHALCFALERQGVGVSLGIGIGAGVDVSAPDVLDHLVGDDATCAVALHVETVNDGPALLDSVRRLTVSKPVVAMVVGQHDIGEFAQSHTGALATSWRTTRALLREAGAVIADDEDTLVTAVSVLARTRLGPRHDVGAALVTAQAGPGLLIADALHGYGVTLPKLRESTREKLSALLPPMTYQDNPVDTGRPGPHHADVIAAVGADSGIDLVAVYGLSEPVVDLPQVVADSGVAMDEDLAAVVGLDGLATEVEHGRARSDELGLASVVGARALATAVRVLADDARSQARRADVAAVNVARETGLRLSHGPWTEAEGKDVLAAAGIGTPARAVCRSLAEALAAAEDLGWPLAVKISDASVVHKSESGGVFLGISSPAELEAAVHRLLGMGASEYLLEEMAPEGIDLVVGVRRDPVFGPVVLVGVGGIATEVYSDVAIARLPSTAAHLGELPDQLAAAALLDGFRGGPPLDRGELGRTCAALGDLLVANDHVAEIEINPLRVHAGGLLALDAVLLESTAPIPTEDSAPRRADRR